MVHMIPSSWTPHHRPSDEELVGYLVPQEEAVVPVTLFGYPLAGPSDPDDARRLLEVIGLSILGEPWQLELIDGSHIRVKIREVSAEQVVVFADDFGFGGDLADSFVLEVPEPGRLSR
jgi:hypothetical protein